MYLLFQSLSRSHFRNSSQKRVLSLIGNSGARLRRAHQSRKSHMKQWFLVLAFSSARRGTYRISLYERLPQTRLLPQEAVIGVDNVHLSFRIGQVERSSPYRFSNVARIIDINIGLVYASHAPSNYNLRRVNAGKDSSSQTSSQSS